MHSKDEGLNFRTHVKSGPHLNFSWIWFWLKSWKMRIFTFSCKFKVLLIVHKFWGNSAYMVADFLGFKIRFWLIFNQVQNSYLQVLKVIWKHIDWIWRPISSTGNEIQKNVDLKGYAQWIEYFGLHYWGEIAKEMVYRSRLLGLGSVEGSRRL